MLFVINFKAYEQGIGSAAIDLVRACAAQDVSVMLAVQTADIRAIAKEGSAKVLAQHVDANGFGSFTGSQLPEAAKVAGAVGSLINHCERPIPLEQIEQTVKRLRDLKMTSIVCAPSPRMVQKIAKFKPDFIAYEPPELVGGNVSVVSAREDLLKEAIDLYPNVICGAGINSRADVVRAEELGAKGVLVASAIVKAKDPKVALRDLVG